MLNEITLSGIIAWLEQQPEGRMFTPRSASNCLVNQYVADQLGLKESLVCTMRGHSFTLSGAEIDRYICHPPEIEHLIIEFDSIGVGARPIFVADALRIVRSVLEDRQRESIATAELLDLSVPLLLSIRRTKVQMKGDPQC